MNRNTLVLRKEKIEVSYLYHFMIGIMLGVAPSIISLSLVLLYLCFAYQKGLVTYLVFCFSLFTTCIVTSQMLGILYAVFAVFVFTCMKGYEMLKLNPLLFMSFWNTAMILLTCYFMDKEIALTLRSGAICLVLHYVFIQNYQKDKKENTIIIFTAIASLYLILSNYVYEYHLLYSLPLLCLLAYTMSFNICVPIFIYMSFYDVSYLYLLFLLFINNNKDKRMVYSFLSIAFLLYEINLTSIVFMISCIFLGMLSYQEDAHFTKEAVDIEKSHQLYMQHSFYKQLINYGNIFYDLSKYYEDLNVEQAQMLHLMGDALVYNAKVSKRYFYMKEEKLDRINQMLKGYKFDLLNSEYVETENKVRITLELQHLYDGEIETTIQPLLEKVTQTRLCITNQVPFPFQKDKIKIVFENEDYLQITTYGNSIHVKEVSGDSFHTVSIQDNIVCMLSDGMGQGTKAKKVSGLLIQMMETMMRCEIPQIECVKMMNHFMRSDIYATLDVLSFDRKRNVAYLSKSASAPTYLYRENKLYEMNAHSLPIGIVDNIQADVFEIPFKKEDIFIMVSDGIIKEEIEKWHALKRCRQVKNEGLNMMNILKDKGRVDDSTILLAKVS